MAFKLEDYRMRIAGLSVLIADISECFDHLRDLCGDDPTVINRNMMASFCGDLDRLDSQLSTALVAFKKAMQEDKSQIKARVRCYKQDHFKYLRSRSGDAPNGAPGSVSKAQGEG